MDAKPVTSKLQTSTLAGWLMAAPVFVLIGLFVVIPFFFAFGLSFTNQRLISPNPTEYIGAGNFKQLLGLGVLNLEPVVDEATKAPVLDASGAKTYPAVRSITRKNPAFPQYDGMREWFSFHWGDNLVTVIAKDVIFMKALVNTFIFVIVVAPLQGGLALMLALMINQKLPGNNGLLNTLLNFLTFGLFKPVDWLGQSSTALGSIIAMSIWQAVGFHMVIWLSGLQTIPATLYEAADIEGASGWQKFSYITWPGLRNTAILVLIVITMQAFGLFSQVDVMTSGGPVDSTQTVVYQAVQRGYAKQDIATGSTISIILFFIVLSISLLQRFLTREKK
jgi:multiple sugar transport system permease protein